MSWSCQRSIIVTRSAVCAASLLAGTVRKHSVMALRVLSRPAQAWPTTHTHTHTHVSKTQGGSFIQQHILSRQQQAVRACVSSVCAKVS